MANNAMPDSIIMNMMCRNLRPPVELNEPNVMVCSNEASKNTVTVRILNTIKPVTRALTTMDAAKPVVDSTSPQTAVKDSESFINAPSAASQVARGNKSKSAYQMKPEID